MLRLLIAALVFFGVVALAAMFHFTGPMVLIVATIMACASFMGKGN